LPICIAHLLCFNKIYMLTLCFLLKRWFFEMFGSSILIVSFLLECCSNVVDGFFWNVPQQKIECLAYQVIQINSRMNDDQRCRSIEKCYWNKNHKYILCLIQSQKSVAVTFYKRQIKILTWRYACLFSKESLENVIA